VDSAKARLLEEQRWQFRQSVKWAAFPLLFGGLDFVNVLQRLPITHGLYGIETMLMALNAISAGVAFAALITRRRWGFIATAIWLVLGTIRFLGVGHLQ
jgi:hypothetical protein